MVDLEYFETTFRQFEPFDHDLDIPQIPNCKRAVSINSLHVKSVSLTFHVTSIPQ